MKISLLQSFRLNRLKIKRLKNIDQSALSHLTGPEVDGVEVRDIIDLFCSEQNLAEESSGTTASYVIQTRKGEILLFFSIRCGELFTLANKVLLELAFNAWVALKRLVTDQTLSDEQKKELLDEIQKARVQGLNIGEIEAYAEKRNFFEGHETNEPNTDINRVYKVFPGIELKLFGINESSKKYWKSMKMHRKMGETLFWKFVIPEIIKIQEHVGIEYLYLFAADKEADGDLINYYKSRLLHIDDTNVKLLSANKPIFDKDCRFLYQTIEVLRKQRTAFFNDFNSDEVNII